tara:strand:- start:53 stop:742 length:690 start_codon:yes stop_codon:yes gene_type:complete
MLPKLSASPKHIDAQRQHRQLLAAGIAALNIDCSPKQLNLLMQYLDLLVRWNNTYNLTAIREPTAMISLHLLDSLAVHSHITEKKRLIDVGTGPGLPGIPLAIMNPDKHFSLLDSAGKKTRFLFQVRTELKLENVIEINKRAETYEPLEHYDTVLSRAFSSLSDMLDTCAHLLTAQGCFMAMKGRLSELELSGISSRYTVDAICRLNIPEVEGERHLVTLTQNKLSSDS